MTSVVLALLITACNPQGGRGGSADSGSAGDGGVTDGGNADAGSADAGASDGGGDDPVLSWSDGDRVLIYTGHGGMQPQGSGKARFEQAEARFEALGYNTHFRDALPDDLTIYRLLLLVAPGSTQAVPFDDADVARIEEARATGTRVALLGDPTMCAAAEVDDLLAALGADVRFTGEGADDNQIIVATDLGGQQPVEGVGSLFMRDPCYVDAPAGAWLARDDLGNALASIELPADGGEIVVLGDLELLDDGSIDEADNAIFADKLALLR